MTVAVATAENFAAAAAEGVAAAVEGAAVEKVADTDDYSVLEQTFCECIC